MSKKEEYKLKNEQFLQSLRTEMLKPINHWIS